LYGNRHFFDSITYFSKEQAKKYLCVKTGYDPWGYKGVLGYVHGRNLIRFDSCDIVFTNYSEIHWFNIYRFITINEIREKKNSLILDFHIEGFLRDIYGLGTMEFMRLGQEVVFQKMDFKRKYIAVHPASKRRKKEK
jgi:hypothetical protein